MRVDRRDFLTYVGGTALGVLAFDNFGNIKTVAAPLPGGTLDVASVPKFVTALVVPPAMPPLYAIVLLRVVESGSDHGCEYWRDDYCVDDIKQLDLHDLCRAMAWLGEVWRPWIKPTARWFPVASRM